MNMTKPAAATQVTLIKLHRCVCVCEKQRHVQIKPLITFLVIQYHNLCLCVCISLRHYAPEQSDI